MAFFFAVFLAAFFLAAMLVSPVFVEVGNVVRSLKSPHVNNNSGANAKRKTHLTKIHKSFFAGSEFFS